MRPGLLPLSVLLAVATLAADDAAGRIRTQEKALSKSVAWVRLVTSADEEGGDDSSGVCSGPVLSQGGRIVVLCPDVGERLKSVKILREDGKEEEASVLAHDADLGLMYVVAKDAKAAGLVPVDAPKAAKEPKLGDALLLVDRRSHGSPDETVCRQVRVCCALEHPEHAWLYTGISSQQMGGLVVTPSGEVVGVVAILKDRGPEGEEVSLPAVLSLDRLLASIPAMEAPEVPKPDAPKDEPKKDAMDQKKDEPHKEEKP